MMWNYKTPKTITNKETKIRFTTEDNGILCTCWENIYQYRILYKASTSFKI